MKKTKKQLLGLAGLAAVGIMTAVAYSLPAPDASAVEEREQTTKVQVLVGERTASATFTSPANGSATTKSIIPVSLNVSKVKRVEFRLVRRPTATTPSPYARAVIDNPADATGELLYACDFDETQSTATCSFDFDPTLYDGFGEYVIEALIVDFSDNTWSAVDTVAFSYVAVTAEYKGVDNQRDPIIGGSVSKADVTSVAIALYNGDGSRFTDKDGKDVIVRVDNSAFDASGNFLATLPFKKYNTKAGDYAVTVTAYDVDGNIIDMTDPIKFAYSPVAPVTPDTPNTGFLSGSLNISRSDIIVTALIAFTLVAGFALFTVFRRNRHI